MRGKRVGGGDCGNMGKIWKKWTWEITYMRKEKKRKKEKRKENYGIMEKWIERGKENIVIICGDFNAITAEEGGLWDLKGEKEERKSKEKKT